MKTLETDRLILRQWHDSDRAPFARMNADPEVTRYLGGPLTREGSDALVDRMIAHWERHGFGLFATELRKSAEFIGYIGLAVPGFDTPFMPAVEIGWRLARDYWNAGLATEGARAVLQYAFGELGLRELVSFTVPDNRPSRRVMEKLGMSRDEADDFDHPRFPVGHSLHRHVLYRLRA